MMPVGLEAVACSMMRAMSARSPDEGLRYSTFTPRSCSAFFSAFLIVFHHESESGAWLTKTKRSPSACAAPAAAATGRAKTAARSVLRMRLNIEPSSLKTRADFARKDNRPPAGGGLHSVIWNEKSIFHLLWNIHSTAARSQGKIDAGDGYRALLLRDGASRLLRMRVNTQRPSC